MVHGKNRIPYRIDRRLTGLAGPEYHAIISFGLPLEPEDSQYGKCRLISYRFGLFRVYPSLCDRNGLSAGGDPAVSWERGWGDGLSPPPRARGPA